MAMMMKWLPVVNASRCTGCGRCVKVCGLELRSVRGGISLLDEPTRCPGEELCVVACPERALNMEWVAVPGDED